MPQAIIPIAVAAATGGAAAAAIAAIGAGLSFLGAKIQAQLSRVDERVANQTIDRKGPIPAAKLWFGEGFGAGDLTYFQVTNNAEVLHLLHTLAWHPMESIDPVQLNEIPIYDRMLDVYGFVNNYQSGVFGDGHKFSSLLVQDDCHGVKLASRTQVRIHKDLGTSGAAWPSDTSPECSDWPTWHKTLNTLPDEWTSDHRQEGRSKLWARLKQDAGFFKSGVPNISVYGRGDNTVTDIRDSSTGYTNNSALLAYHYMTLAKDQLGLGWSTDLLDTASFQAAANTCDERVTAASETFTLTYTTLAGGGSDTIDTNELAAAKDTQFRNILQTGDGVEIQSTTGSLPTGLSLSTTYYVIVTAWTGAFEGSLNETWRIQLASTYANALAHTPINLTTAGSGTHTCDRVDYPRFTCNLPSIDSSRKRSDILKDILDTCGGRLVPKGGKIGLKVAQYETPTLTFSDSDLRGPLRIQTQFPRSQHFNAVKGTYVNPSFYGQGTNFPELQSSTAVSNDGSEVIYREFNFAGISRPQQAQRVAKWHLERNRRPVTFTAPFKLKALQLAVGDTFQFTYDRNTWSSKVFEVLELTRDFVEVNGASGCVGCTITAQETDSGVDDWDNGDESDIPDTVSLPGLDEVGTPTNLVLTQQLSTLTPGTTEVIATWTAPTDGPYQTYQVEIDDGAGGGYTVHEAFTSAETSRFTGLLAGKYNVRVAARNRLELGDYVTTTIEVVNDSGFPDDPTNFVVTIVGGMAVATWDQSDTFQVLNGGSCVIRHDSDSASGDWVNSHSLAGGTVSGSATQAILPLISGTYLLKFKTTSPHNNLSETAAEFVIDQSEQLESYTDNTTVVEASGFSGTKTNLTVTTGTLHLTESGTTVPSTTGTYEFANTLDIGSNAVKRLTVLLDTTVRLIDSDVDATENVDSIQLWDGVEGSEADVYVEARFTHDDPTGSPSWGGWQRIDSGEYEFWGAEFRAQFSTTLDTTNIDVTTLTIDVDNRA